MRHFWQAVVTTLAGALAATAAHAQEIAPSVAPADLPIVVGRYTPSIPAAEPSPSADPISIHQPISVEDAQYSINQALFGQPSTAAIPMTDFIQPDGPSTAGAFDFSWALSTSPQFTGLDEGNDELAAQIEQQYQANLETSFRATGFNEQVQSQVGNVGRWTAVWILGGWLMNEANRDRWANLGEDQLWRATRRAAVSGADRPEPPLQDRGRALTLPPE